MTLTISLEGIRIEDETTQVSVQISQILAELTEHSLIIIQISSNPSSRKNLDVRPYDRATVQGATCNMRGQLYHGHANATALSSIPVVSALGSVSDDLGKALEKKMQAPLLRLAKSIYYLTTM